MPTAKAARRRRKAARSAPKPAPITTPFVHEPSLQSPDFHPLLSAEALKLRQQVAAAAVLALMTFVIYYQVIHHPFSNYDDSEYVGDNARVHDGLTRSTLRWALTSTEHANWHPVTWLSHALDWQLFGPLAAGHHFTNLLLHVLNVALLFFFLVRVTRSTARSLAVAALFALHPINVESVAWIAERKNVLCVFFFLLALLAYVRYARRPNVTRYLLVALLFAFGLAAKPMVVTFPFVLLLLDYWPMQRILGWSNPSPAFSVPQFTARKLALEKLPFLLLSAADCLLTVIAQQKANAIRPVTVFPFTLRLQNAVFSSATYLWKTVWPVRLGVLYPYPAGGIAAWRLAVGTLVLFGLSMWALRDRRRPYLLTGWLWFLGTLVPVIGLVQVGEQGMADRYAYLPLIGIFMMLAWLGFDLVQKAEKTACWMAGVAAGFALCTLAILTFRQVGFWKTNYALWAHTAAVTENNVDAEDVAGSELLLQAMNKGLNYSSEAQVHFRRALQMNPNDSEALMNIGADLQAHGRVAEALQKYQLALQHVDDRFLKGKIVSDIGAAYEQMGDFATAREYYRQGLQISPGTDNSSFLGYARTFTDEKIAALTVTLTAHPTADGYLQLGALQDSAGYIAAASHSYQRVLELDPNLEAARTALERDSKSNP